MNTSRSSETLKASQPGFRLLALDIDGTLLDESGVIRPGMPTVLRQLRDSGNRVVLCTGRCHRKARPIAEQLELNLPLICNSGALIKHGRTGRTIFRVDLPNETLERVLTIFDASGRDSVSFLDDEEAVSPRDFVAPLTTRGCPLFEEFLTRNSEFGLRDHRWPSRPDPQAKFHLCGLGPHQEMLVLADRLQEALGETVRTFVQRSPRYRGHLCEVVDQRASKWHAIQVLCRSWAIDEASVMAVGDDMNDEPMLAGAGLGVAMPQAPAPVTEAADQILPAGPADALARLIAEQFGLDDTDESPDRAIA